MSSLSAAKDLHFRLFYVTFNGAGAFRPLKDKARTKSSGSDSCCFLRTESKYNVIALPQFLTISNPRPFSGAVEPKAAAAPQVCA
jgi:hypothetical protein